MQESSNKSIHVVAGIICKRENGCLKYFATKRGYGEFKGKWEFPGGKIEKGEFPKMALARELKEELLVDVEVGNFLCTVEYDYPNFHLIMHCFFCKIIKGELTLLEHEKFKWLGILELDSLEWLPADIQVIKKIKDVFK